MNEQKNEAINQERRLNALCAIALGNISVHISTECEKIVRVVDELQDGTKEQVEEAWRLIDAISKLQSAQDVIHDVGFELLKDIP